MNSACRALVSAMLALVCLGHSIAAHAHKQWEYRVQKIHWGPENGSGSDVFGPSTIYPTLAEAEAAMKALAGPAHGPRLKPAGIRQADNQQVIYRYTLDDLPVDPIITPYVYSWSYHVYPHIAHDGTGFASEAEAWASATSEAFTGNDWDSYCGPDQPTLTLVHDFWTLMDGPPEVTSKWGRKTWGVERPSDGQACGALNVHRERTVDCPVVNGNPVFYSLQRNGPAPYCRPFTGIFAYIIARPLECPSTGGSSRVGNPCDAASGDKHQAEIDYAAAGLEFVRHHHSAGLPSVTTLGAAWTHNFGSRLVLNTAGTSVTAYVRRDGYHDAFTVVGSAGYATKSGSGAFLSTVGSEYIIVQNDGTREIYNGTGALDRLVDKAGRTTQLYYSQDVLTGQSVPTSIVGPFGHSLLLNYDAGLLASITDPEGKTIAYSYEDKKLTQVTFQDGSSKTYHYENASFPRHLTGITDERGIRFATYQYDSVGRAQVSEHAGGAARVSLVYNTNDTVVTDAAGRVTTYGFTESYSGSRRLTTKSFNGVTETYTLPPSDWQRRVTQIRDRRNLVTKFIYDSTHLKDLIEAFGTPTQRTTTYTYLSADDDLIIRQTVKNSSGTLLRDVLTTYNAQRLPETTTLRGDIGSGTIVDRVTTYGYNTAGQVTSIDGPRTDVNDTTTLTYYGCMTGFECGQLQSTTNAAGHLTSYTAYNAHGQPVSMTDANGVVTTLAYDLRQRLIARTVGNEQTTLEYWPNGLVKRVTLPDASYLEYAYDDAQRLMAISDASGHRLEYTLDAMGNRIEEKSFDPSGTLTQMRTRVFNTLNQLWQEIGAAGTTNVTTTFAYDNNDNQTGINAPLGRNTVQAYDELSRLRQVTDPAGGITGYAYNALDQLISVTDPRTNVTSYGYNGLGDLTQQASPDTGTTTKTYDIAGNLATRTDARGKVATYAWDELNRLTSVTYPDQTISYTYDSGPNQKSRLTQVTDASGSTEWTYDARGRVLLQQQTIGALSKSLGHSYDGSGRPLTLTLPSGNTITYGYSDGRITSLSLNGVTTILSNVLYQPFGPTRGWTWGNGTLAVREYDLDGKLTGIDSAGLKTYGYDDAFRFTSIIDAIDPTLSQSYAYDLLDRLTSATGTGLNQSWTYDANGNRLTQGGSDASTYTISPFSNRVTSISGALSRTYSYDAAGNTTGTGAVAFSYNDAGRLVSATKAGVTTTYAINALGQRVKKTTGEISTHIVYDAQGHLVGEYDSAGDLIQETVWFGDIPVAVLKTDGAGVSLFYVHTDHLSTPRRISRPSDNAIVWRWDGDAFGTTPASEDPDGDSSPFGYNVRFPGQYFDSETGLHYNYFRDYDPSAGRYVQSDPIGLRGGLNTYGYANSSPTTFVDPRGLDPWAGPSAGGRVDILIGGYAARTGSLTNTKTGETCFVSYRCLNVGVGALGTLGAELSGSILGPRCGRGLDGIGVSLTLDIVPPGAPGIGGSIDITGAGLGVGVGPNAGAGAFTGFQFCIVRVLSCLNTPCECSK